MELLFSDEVDGGALWVFLGEFDLWPLFAEDGLGICCGFCLVGDCFFGDLFFFFSPRVTGCL